MISESNNSMQSKKRPSATAQSVAKSVLLASFRTPFRERMAGWRSPTEWFLESLPGSGSRLPKLLRRPLYRTLATGVESWLAPGLSSHIAVRKLWIERLVRQCIKQGCRQIVVVGAGLDTLAFRISSAIPSVQCWEIDRDETQRFKRAALERRNRLPTNLQLIPGDLNRCSLNRLLQRQFMLRCQEPTVYVTEGLLMYLDQSRVEELLRSMRICSPRGRIIGTAVTTDESAEISLGGGSAFNRLLYRAVGESFRWGLSPHELPRFLSAQKIPETQIFDPDDILRRLELAEAGMRIPRGEYCFSASWNEEPSDFGEAPLKGGLQ